MDDTESTYEGWEVTAESLGVDIDDAESFTQHIGEVGSSRWFESISDLDEIRYRSWRLVPPVVGGVIRLCGNSSSVQFKTAGPRSVVAYDDDCGWDRICVRCIEAYAEPNFIVCAMCAYEQEREAKRDGRQTVSS